MSGVINILNILSESRDRLVTRIAALDADLKDTVRRRDRAEAELAALNARRCETCGRLPGGCCIAEDLEIFSESPIPYCSRWAERGTS